MSPVVIGPELKSNEGNKVKTVDAIWCPFRLLPPQKNSGKLVRDRTDFLIFSDLQDTAGIKQA